MMTRASINAVTMALLLSACAQGVPTGVPEAAQQRTPSSKSGDSSSAACKGTATKSVDGKPRKVHMEVTPCRVPSKETPQLALENVGKSTVGYAPAFTLEKKTRGGWRWINRRQAFTEPLFYLEPGERSDPQPIAVYLSSPKPIPLHPGVYRVTKGIDLTPGEPRPPTMAVSARFRVVGQP
jgi:hypothetical protein